MPRAPKATPASTALATSKKANTNLVDIKAQLAAQVAALAERTSPATGASIRVTQSKKFKFPDGDETGDAWSAVIVDYTCQREFYTGTYDPDNISPPACFAISDKPKGMVPSDNSPEKQADNCDDCPNNQWGSDGKRGKACKEVRKLAIMPPAEDGEDIAQTPIWLMKVSPTAIKPFDAYVTSVGKTYGLPPVGVVSQVAFDPASDFPSVRLSHPEPNPAVAEHFARQSEARDMLAVEPDVSGYGQEKPQPAARGRVAAKRPAARRN